MPQPVRSGAGVRPRARWRGHCGRAQWPSRFGSSNEVSAQRGDPSDMQSDAGRRSEAGEVCHSGAWREDHRAVRRSQEAWAEELFLSFWTRPWRASTRAGEAKEQLFPHRDGSAGERSEQRAVRRRSRSNLKSPEPPPQLKRAASHTTGLRRPSLYAEAVPACSRRSCNGRLRMHAGTPGYRTLPDRSCHRGIPYELSEGTGRAWLSTDADPKDLRCTRLGADKRSL